MFWQKIWWDPVLKFKKIIQLILEVIARAFSIFFFLFVSSLICCVYILRFMLFLYDTAIYFYSEIFILPFLNLFCKQLFSKTYLGLYRPLILPAGQLSPCSPIDSVWLPFLPAQTLRCFSNTQWRLWLDISISCHPFWNVLVRRRTPGWAPMFPDLPCQRL